MASGDKAIGSVDDFSSLPHEIYLEAVHEIAKAQSLIDRDKYEIECSAGSFKGDNYLGVVYRIRLRCTSDKAATKLSLIAKLPPQNEARREQATTKLSVEREILFYDEIYPLYEQFQREKNIEVDTMGFHEIPLCHKTLNVAPHEGIFLEDLKASGFEMFDRFKDVGRDHVELVMKALAKMHAIFFCINDQCPAVVESYRDMEDFFLAIGKQNSMLDMMYNGQKKLALETLERSKNFEYKERIEKFLDTDVGEVLQSVFGSKIAEPHATICHGDCWNNNVMFRNDKSGKPVEARLLDFQIIRYASPVLDVVHYLFTSTTKELRDEHYNDFLDIYYDTLSDFIRRLGSDPEKLFPRGVFAEHLTRFGKYALFISILLLPIITSTPDDTIDFDRISEKLKESTDARIEETMTMKTSEKYEKQMMGVFFDVCKLGYV